VLRDVPLARTFGQRRARDDQPDAQPAGGDPGLPRRIPGLRDRGVLRGAVRLPVPPEHIRRRAGRALKGCGRRLAQRLMAMFVKLCHHGAGGDAMATMNVSLPDPMKEWVEAQAATGRYSNASDYVRDLIR